MLKLNLAYNPGELKLTDSAKALADIVEMQFR
jgi:hypothetical protein